MPPWSKGLIKAKEILEKPSVNAYDGKAALKDEYDGNGRCL